MDVILFSILVFLIHRWTSVDPHYATKNDKLIPHICFSLITTTCYWLLKNYDWGNLMRPLLASYIIYSIYMPAVNPPTHWRKDEYSSWFEGFIASQKENLGGVAIIKLLCLLLAVSFVGRISNYWLLVIVILGIGMLVTKVFILHLKIQSGQDEWENVKNNINAQDELMAKYSSIMWLSVIAFGIFSVYYALPIIEYGKLNALLWSYVSVFCHYCPLHLGMSDV